MSHPLLERASSALIRLGERHVAGRRTGPPLDREPGAPGPRAPEREPHADAAAYQRRRDVNVQRLSRVDALMAYSDRSAEIFQGLGVGVERLRRVQINPSHVEGLGPKRSGTPRQPLRFAVLNAANSTHKGADLLVGALALLHDRGLTDRFRLSVRGWIAPHVVGALHADPSVTLDGDYRAEELDELLEGVDVGIVPSVWEEVYGFVGAEFLAKGIPVIGNALGGIPQYVRPGQTGWLTEAPSPAGLADAMAHVIADPGQIAGLSRRILELRDELIRPMSDQLADLEAIYRSVLRSAGSAARSSGGMARASTSPPT